MRIVLDLQCCQTAAQDRGMGRYALALTRELVRRGTPHDFFFLLNARLLSASGPLLQELDELEGRRVIFDAPELGSDISSRAAREHIANLLRNDRVETLSPDVYHVWSVFEGDAIFGEAVPWLSLPAPPIINSVTAYDLIPAVYPDEYLREPRIRSSFNKTMAISRQFDIHLAISNATKDDVERILQVDTSKVSNVSGDVDPFFRMLAPGEKRYGASQSKLGKEPFVLYVGGPDFRKNIFGILDGFAGIAATLPRRHLLVLVLSLDGETTRRLQARADELRIGDQLFVTGFIGNSELRELYNSCTLFLFPSIYEGLGMPVIEAMRCGAPVLVGDNSSLIEIVPEPSYRFDATSSEAMGVAMRRVLLDPIRLAQMRDYSINRAACFGWSKSAEAVLGCWAEAVERRSAERRVAARNSRHRPRVAMFTPLPNEKTGIADYAADFIPALERQAELEIYVDDVLTINESSISVPVLHHSEFAARCKQYDAVIYQLGNSPYHHYMLPHMRRFPGVIVLHDAYVGHLKHDPGNSVPFIRSILEEEGGAARALVEHCVDPFTAARVLIEQFSCGGAIVDGSLGVIVHSAFARATLRKVANPCAGARIVVMQQYRAGIPSERRLDKITARSRLGIDTATEIVATFGHVASTKGILELIEAFVGCNACGRGALLVFVGELEGGAAASTPYAQSVLSAIAGRSNIVITGFVDQETYDLWLCALDIAVQLRTLSRGETSGAMLNHLMNAKPFIFNRLGPAGELPAQVALGLDDYEPGTVRDALNSLLDNKGARSALSQAAADYCREVLDAAKIAESFIFAAIAMTGRARTCGPAPLARKIADVLAAEADINFLANEIAAAFVRQERSELLPRMLLEVGSGEPDDEMAALLQAAFRSPDRTLRPFAFRLANGQPVGAAEVVKTCGAALPFEQIGGGEPVNLRPFDRVLMVNNALSHGNALRPFAADLRLLGGTLVALIDDLGPIERPKLYPSRLADAASASLDILLEHASGLICASPRVARRLAAHISAGNAPVGQNLRIAVLPRSRRLSSTVDIANEIGAPFFLLAVPLRPEEGHSLVIEGFEQHWREGGRAHLVVLTALGWNLCETLDRYAQHGMNGHCLHLRPGTCDLEMLHTQAIAAIIPTDTEACRDALDVALDCGTPVLHADLDMLRAAVRKDLAVSFHANDAASLAEAIASSRLAELQSKARARENIAPVDRAAFVLELSSGRGWSA